MMNTSNNQKPGTSSQNNGPTSSDRLATCSMIAGITGVICSFFYIPFTLTRGTNSPTGMLCGIIGIILAIMAKNADTSEKKHFNARAITGIVLGAIAIGITLFFLVMLGQYYDILKDPVLGPQINEYINQLQQQINQQLQLYGGSSWIHL